LSESRPRFRTPLLQRIFESIREGWDPEFTFLAADTIPWTSPSASLADTRVALISTGGLHVMGDEPFRTMEEPLGDTSFRVIPHGTESGGLDLKAPYVDKKYIANDLEVALPMKALERLHSEGLIGPPAACHYSFTGGIVRPLPGLAESADRLADILREDGAGACVLLPTCSLCVQTVSVVARELESRGFPTVTVSLIPELSEIVGAPRTLTVHFPFGAPCGNPGNGGLHRAVLLEALTLLVEAKSPGEMRASNNAWRGSPSDDAD
jgi:D-proline reductase (dithiol) PrdB